MTCVDEEDKGGRMTCVHEDGQRGSGMTCEDGED